MMAETVHDISPAVPDASESLGAVQEVIGSASTFTPADELMLQQLLQARFWYHAKNEGPEPSEAKAHPGSGRLAPSQLELTRGVVLHPWQEQCVQAWFSAGRRGIVKVVTGAGKTLLGLSIVEQLSKENPNLRVAVIVPSVVLLAQWRAELTERSNLPPDAIGLMGGGHSDQFDDRKRLLICVLNSAARKLKAEVDRAQVGDELLLLVDECHRAGAAEMRHIFQVSRRYSLGLSATPERDDDAEVDGFQEETPEELDAVGGFEDTVLGRELGPVIFELNYAEAIRNGILPPFTINHYGLSLLPKEAEKYERVSREITDLRADLETGSRRGLALIRWCRSKAAANNPKATRLVSLTAERKRLLYRMQQRRAAVVRLLQNAFLQNAETKAILFHESIEEVMAIFDLLRAEGYPVVAEHSGFPDPLRAESLRLFREGTARIIISARSLIEGFNVPSADLGIIVAASASVRQRVQTLGRLLRKGRREDGSEKSATLCVLYASKTVDELIYEKADWEHFVGANRNEYFRWPDVASSEPSPRPDPPRRPVPIEREVDPATLTAGGLYPGDTDEGILFTVDTQGTVRDESGRLTEPHLELQGILSAHLKGGGKFRVTSLHRYVTRLEKTADGWRGMFLGRLTTPVRMAASVDEPIDVEHLSPGDVYPLSAVRGETFSVLQRDPRLIARKQKGKIRFVRPLEQIEDPEKRSRQQEIQKRLSLAYTQGHRISKITVTPEGYVVYVWQNKGYFVGAAPEGSKGFVFEEHEDN